MENWMNLVISIITGLTVCIPLVIELVKYVRKAVKEKNWTSLTQLVLKLMAEAEQNYQTGAERKEYVLDSVKALEKTLDYDVDIDVVSTLIDSLAEMAKKGQRREITQQNNLGYD